MHSVQNSNTFLGWYNKIDKVLAYIIGGTKYIPFTEKVSIIAEGDYPISQFVKLYQNKLRYFGDLRNQLVHGFSLDKKHYVVASDYAVNQISFVHTELTKPRTVGTIFTHEIYTCCLDDRLKDVITVMRDELNTHVPVYDASGKFVEMLSESTIAYWVADQIGDDGGLHIDQSKVGDVPLENSNDTYVFVEEERSIYEIETLFATSFAQKKRLGAVFVTKTGSDQEKITGIITAMDLPKLANTVILE